jgi:hypothetical protein
MKYLKISLLSLMLCLEYGVINAQTQKGNDIDGEAIGDGSGYALSMPDINTLAIGAPENDGNGTDAGHVRIHNWNGTAWIQKGLDIDGEATEDISGWSVSMGDANTISIGAVYNDNSGGINAGHVRVYSWNGSAWIQKGTDIDGETANDLSAWSISMPDANTVAIGAPFNSGSGSIAGHVRVWSWNGIDWAQKGLDINGEAAGDNSGYSVSMPDANTVAIGAQNNDGNGNGSGHVRIYNWNGTAWVQKGLDINGEAANDQSGHSVCMPDANTVGIGAIGNDGNGNSAGQVRIYSWNGTTWIQKGLDIDGEAADDLCGKSISMPDANTVAIGANENDGNGSNSGHVRVYKWNGTAWTQQGIDINGEAAGDESGYAICMPDANTVSIGAGLNSGNGSIAGHVRVYQNFPFPLSVELSKFMGQKLPYANELKWTTVREQNNAYFNLQHSKNGLDFETIAKVNSQTVDGNSQTALEYSFEHTTPLLGHNYYRLEQVDVDNQRTLNTEIVDLYLESIDNTVSIHPNPTQDVLYIDMYTLTVQNTTVKVINMNGNVVKELQIQSKAGNSTLSININELVTGLYTLQVYGNNKLTHVYKVSKTK